MSLNIRVHCMRIVLFLISFLSGALCGVRWENLHCASDTEQTVPEGKVPDIGRFPWFGLLQHTFYLGGKTRFAVTNGVLVHPSYVIASAEDVARIRPEAIANSTKFIIWRSATVKYSMDIDSYYLPPEYTEGTTLASLAVLHIAEHHGEESSRAPVPPVCLPFSGAGVFDGLYAVKMTDETGEVEKEVYEMNHVESQDCEEFYYTHKLYHKVMSPVRPFCASCAHQRQPCVWDSGVALISRQTWGFWKLIGFSVRGPGCSAPTRFLYIHDYLLWIDEVISHAPDSLREQETAIVFRRVSPIKLIMYSAKVRQPKEMGQCERGKRGSIMYKDTSEVLLSKNFAQGYFFLSVAQVAQMNCAVVVLDVNARTNAAVWVENHCHSDVKFKPRIRKFRSREQVDCFVYFKSVAYVEFRFYFSFKAILEVALYGNEEVPKNIPNPFFNTQGTYSWWPTYTKLRQWNFMPLYAWWWLCTGGGIIFQILEKASLKLPRNAAVLCFGTAIGHAKPLGAYLLCCLAHLIFVKRYSGLPVEITPNNNVARCKFLRADIFSKFA